jgi:hypothetical protein
VEQMAGGTLRSVDKIVRRNRVWYYWPAVNGSQDSGVKLR